MAAVAEPPAGPQYTYTQQFRRCGKPGCLTCAPDNRGHGPYWYAYWREEGRVHSRYLGKEAPQSAAPDVAPRLRRRPRARATMPSVPLQDTLRVRTLGGFQVWRGGKPIPAQHWNKRKAATLFKCLLGAPGLRLHREQLVEILWPAALPSASAGNLRVSVHHLRKILDGTAGSHIQSDGGWLVLAPAPCAEPAVNWLDATDFAGMAATALSGDNVATCKAALARYTGDYLPDDAYEPWAIEPRHRLLALRLTLLLHLAELLVRYGRAREAIVYLQAVLEADSCHEAALRSLMRLFAGAGQRADAIRVYHRMVAALKQDLGLRPTRETEALFQALQQE